jgi:hypothetical protein
MKFTRRWLFGLMASPLAARVLPEETRARIVVATDKYIYHMSIEVENNFIVRIETQLGGVAREWSIQPGPRRSVFIPCDKFDSVKLTSPGGHMVCYGYKIDIPNPRSCFPVYGFVPSDFHTGATFSGPDKYDVGVAKKLLEDTGWYSYVPKKGS